MRVGCLSEYSCLYCLSTEVQKMSFTLADEFSAFLSISTPIPPIGLPHVYCIYTLFYTVNFDSVEYNVKL